MVRWSSLLFFICTVRSPVLCCDWLTDYGHLSNNSLALIKLMVSSSNLEQVSEDSFIGEKGQLHMNILS